jgi:hypothetical protein
MDNILKNKIAISIFAGCSLIALSIQNIKPTKAATAEPSGACGAVMDISHKNISPVANGTGYASNILFYFDFDKKKMSSNSSVATFKGPNANGTVDKDSFPTYAQTPTFDVSFTVKPAPAGFPNTWLIQPTGNFPTIIAIAVNGGNTYLLQSGDGRGTGVCQGV